MKKDDYITVSRRCGALFICLFFTSRNFLFNFNFFFIFLILNFNFFKGIPPPAIIPNVKIKLALPFHACQIFCKYASWVKLPELKIGKGN